MKWLFPCLLLVLAACQTPEPPPPVATPRLLDRDAGTQRAPQTWLVLGDGPVYLLGTAGDEQAVLEVEMQRPGVDALALYRDDRRITGEPVYAVETEPLAPDELVLDHGNWPRRTAFAARLVRGQRGRGGAPFLANVSVTVTRVLLARRVPAAQPLLPAPPTYFVFGEGSELFALRVREDRTGAGQVASVRIREGADTESEAAAVRRGTLARFPAALAPAATSDGLLSLPGQAARPVTVETLTDVYSGRISTFDF